MNLVIDDAVEVTIAKKDGTPEERRKIGQILLKGDNSLAFEDVRKVMNLARKAGAKGIALGVEARLRGLSLRCRGEVPGFVSARACGPVRRRSGGACPARPA